MSKGVRAIISLLLLTILSSPAIGDEIASLKAGYMLLSPSGEFAAEENGIGTIIDVEGDLGLDDSQNIMAEAAFSLGDLKLTVGYLPISSEGDSTLSRTIIFNGQVYPVNSSVSSSIDLDILDIGLTYHFINIDDAPTRLQLGVELAAKLTDAQASIVDFTTGVSESASEKVPLPTIGLRARVALSDFIGINGKLGYLGYSDNHFLDADVQLEVSPIPLVGLFAGYRYLDIAIDESDIYVDAAFSGFYGGALIRF